MTTRTAHGARTLDRELFLSEETFRRERERIFERAWLCAGHGCQLPEPGAYFLFTLDRTNVVVLRDEGGSVRAFHNACRHRGSVLCREPAGSVGSRIQCPYHAWTYGLSGSLLAAPNMQEVAGFSLQDHPLTAVHVDLWEGFVFVNLSADPKPLAEAMAPLGARFAAWRLPDLVSAHSTTYEVEANWKLLFHNYSECYHCPVAHPALNRLTPYRNTTNDLVDGPILGGPMTMARAGGSMTMTGARCAPPIGDVSGRDLDLVYYYTIFPNLFLSLHPDYVLAHRSEALTPDRTRILCDWYFHPRALAASDFDPSPAVDFWDMTNRQDWDLCANSHRGISSPAWTPGPYSELESQLAAFDRHYRSVLDSD